MTIDKEEGTYGFNRADASELIQLIEMRDVLTPIDESIDSSGLADSLAYFFVLLEDMPPGDGEFAYANLVDWSRTVQASEVKLYNWGEFLSATGIIDGALVGYGGIAKMILGRWAFWQGECILPCIGDAAFDWNLAPPAATIGQTNYTFTPGTTGTVPASGAFSASGLPANWAIHADTGVITGPNAGAGGVAGPAGTISFTIVLTSPKSGGGTCDSTRYLIITVS